MAVSKRTLRWLLKFPAEALLTSSTTLRKRIDARVEANSRLAAKYYPSARQRSYLVPAAGPDRPYSVQLPVPPPELWICRERTDDEYISTGREHVEAMRRILAAAGFAFEDGSRVLDFGCAGGRMIRWLRYEAERCEIWGADIQARSILWCQQNLSPPFHFVTTTTFPHLPFPDNYFHLIYAAGVFSQFADLAETWMLELRRILLPGGRLYVTINDRHSIDLILDFPEHHRLHYLKELLLAFDEKTGCLRGGFGMFTVRRTLRDTHVFYDVDHLRRTWGRLFRLQSVTPEAYLFQTALVLEKPA